MRKYSPKNDVQKKSYYNDRFHVTPSLPKESVHNDSVLSNDYLSMKRAVGVTEAYIQRGHLVMYVEPQNNFAALKHAKEILCYDFLMELSAIDYIAERIKIKVP